MSHEYNREYKGNGTLQYKNKELIKIEGMSLKFQKNTTKIEGEIINGKFKIQEINKLNKKHYLNITNFFEHIAPKDTIMKIQIKETKETITIERCSLKDIKYPLMFSDNKQFEGNLV